MLMADFLAHSCWSLPPFPTILAVCFVCYSCDHGDGDSLKPIHISPPPSITIMPTVHVEVEATLTGKAQARF